MKTIIQDADQHCPSEAGIFSLIERALKLDVLGKPLLDRRVVKSAVFVGDTHCSVGVTEHVLKKYYDDVDLIVFLGDYVDRGSTGVENLEVILSKLLENLEKIVMLRGNHESQSMNRFYGFETEVHRKFGNQSYRKFVDLFQVMPYAVVVNDYFCVHGGIASDLTKVEDIGSLPFPDEGPENQTAFQLLWNDPREVKGFVHNSRRGEGVYYYGRDVTERFLTDNRLKGILRAHEVVQDGIREDLNGNVVTIFSSTYHGGSAGILLLRDGAIERIRLNLSRSVDRWLDQV